MSATATPRVYCTYFDSGYLSRGLALISSLRSHGDFSAVYVLALDSATETFLTEHSPENVFVINISELETAEPALLPLKAQRSRMEYYFTCTPLLIRYVMNKQNIPGGMSIYLDGDLFFFDSPQNVITAMADSSVGIIEHRYPDSVAAKLAKYGRFNVGWVGFRNDDAGRNVLDWYSEQTLNWCSDKPENGKYADQGYLNWFPEFSGVKILEAPGFNVAPWNTKRHRITSTDSGQVIVDGVPLTFFHFHGLRKVGNWFVTSQLIYKSQITSVQKNHIYKPYVDKLVSIDNAISSYIPDKVISKRGNGVSGLASRIRKQLVNIVSIATGNALKIHN